MTARMVLGALCGAVVLVGAAGCARTADRAQLTTVAEARSCAVEVFRNIAALAPRTWPEDVPNPIANYCEAGKGVQFTSFIEVDAPADPRGLVELAAAHSRRFGYTLSTTDEAVDDETGHVFGFVIRGLNRKDPRKFGARRRAGERWRIARLEPLTKYCMVESS